MPSQREVAIYAPDGTEIIYKTAAKWDVGGIVKYTDGHWILAEYGFSPDSVRKRTLAYYNRTAYLINWSVGRIYEATAPVVREYFGHHRIAITQVWKPLEGWVDVRLHGGRSSIRRLSKQGVTAVRFSADGRLPDFQMAELLKSMRLPKQKMCATAGHGQLPATHKISYNYRGEEEKTTDLVCASCADSYSRRPVLQNFAAIEMAR